MNKGGSYTRKKKGAEPVLVECTQDHKDGNRPRDKDGNALNVAKPEKPKQSKQAQKSAQAKE